MDGLAGLSLSSTPPPKWRLQPVATAPAPLTAALTSATSATAGLESGSECRSKGSSASDIKRKSRRIAATTIAASTVDAGTNRGSPDPVAAGALEAMKASVRRLGLKLGGAGAGACAGTGSVTRKGGANKGMS